MLVPLFGIVAAGQVAGKQHAGDARAVHLVAQHGQVEVQLHVIVEGFRNARGYGDVLIGHRAAGELRHLQAPLDLANVGGPFIHLGAVGGRQILLELGQLLRNRIQNAAVLLAALRALFRALGLHVAEQLLEHDLRIQFHRQRLRGRGPGDRVGVGAAIAFPAIARIGAGIFDRHLQRGDRRLLPDLVGDQLIDGGAVVDVRAGGFLGLVGAHVGRGHPVVRAGDAGRRLGRLRPQSAHDHNLFEQRFAYHLPFVVEDAVKRLHDREHLAGFQPGALRNPVAWGHAMRHEDAGEARRIHGCGLR